ncbi:MAG: acyl carrier protein [Armatimonadota bacterium]
MDNFTKLQEIIALTFGVPAEQVTPATARDDIPAWDSVGHLNLMLALEDAFGLTLDIEDMARLATIPAILEYMARE